MVHSSAYHKHFHMWRVIIDIIIIIFSHAQALFCFFHVKIKEINQN